MTALLFSKKYMARQAESFEWMVIDLSFEACNGMVTEQTNKAWLADTVNVMLNCDDDEGKKEVVEEGEDMAKEMCRRYDDDNKKKKLFGTLRDRVSRMFHRKCLNSRQ